MVNKIIESKIVDSHVENYIRSLLPDNQELLCDLEQYALENHVPIIHKEIAKYLSVMCCIKKPMKILEIGTAIGYSASVFAMSMKSGHIDTIELNELMVEKANETFCRLKEIIPEVTVDIHKGDAIDIIKTLDGGYDLIFIDAAKGHYQVFFEDAFRLLNNGGIIISDNVLYKGMVATNEYLVRRKITIVKRMRKYLKYISDHPSLETSILPFGDGLAISYKKEAIDE